MITTRDLKIIIDIRSCLESLIKVWIHISILRILFCYCILSEGTIFRYEISLILIIFIGTTRTFWNFISPWLCLCTPFTTTTLTKGSLHWKFLMNFIIRISALIRHFHLTCSSIFCLNYNYTICSSWAPQSSSRCTFKNFYWFNIISINIIHSWLLRWSTKSTWSWIILRVINWHTIYNY